MKAVNAVSEESNWSATWNFRTPLVPPVLVAPAADESLLTDRPTFSWDPVLTATQYILQVSAVSNFSTLLVNTTVKTTEYSMTKDLPQNKTIYWRVRSKSSTLTSAFSAKQSFKTGNPPTAPALLTPANGALVNDYTPLLDWKNSTTPTTPINTVFKRYEIQVDDNNDFSSPEINTVTTLDDITDSDFTPDTDLASNTKFYWRVRAVNTNDPNPDEHVSGWSTVWSFRTIISAPTTLAMVPTTNVLRPSFDWDDAIATPSGIIKSYNIQVSTSPTFSTLIVNSTTVLSTYKMASNLPTGKTIYWRVRVNGTNGPSAWSNSQFVMP
jgi:hypothetical protein